MWTEHKYQEGNWPVKTLHYSSALNKKENVVFVHNYCVKIMTLKLGDNP